MKKNKLWLKNSLLVAVVLGIFLIVANDTFAAPLNLPNITLGVGEADSPQELSQSLQIIFLITILGLAPSILIMMTAFLRLIISFHFLRAAIGTQTMPSNQILIGLALFLTFFIMSPVFSNIKTNAWDPYQNNQMTQAEAVERGIVPLKEFMVRQTRDEDIKLFMDLSGRELLQDDSDILNELPLHIVIPAFIISELRTGFIIGFLLYIPFIVIDMIVASTLMSMGMMMLPPVMISLPFKILLFILVDGWNLIIGQLVQTFK
ncbi:flagellar type III secretion system pore protein FliP [Cellulosilyticum sp. I15G10I2]|uniref:flagellar type III secretion system pore protein FliP n=1 Tax=Cellulosilyticum sp. I15G10I2 TaxID=1892843 RepID=UPI00085BDF0C|nr:flagellar type III secretion system pore protein FliP [Cellulosilyticum sp. I15G10I2]